MIDNFRFARHPLRIDFLNRGRLCFRRSLQPSECVGTRLNVGARAPPVRQEASNSNPVAPRYSLAITFEVKGGVLLLSRRSELSGHRVTRQ